MFTVFRSWPHVVVDLRNSEWDCDPGGAALIRISQIYPDYYRPSDPSANERTAYKRARGDENLNNNSDAGTADHSDGMRSRKRQKTQPLQLGRYTVQRPPKGRGRHARTPLPVSPVERNNFNDVTINELYKIDQKLRDNGQVLSSCLQSMGQLWNDDARIRDRRVEGPAQLLKIDFDDVDRGTKAALEHLQQLAEMIIEIRDQM